MELISREEAISRGLKTFFTGKPCKNGHISPRKVHSYACKECAAELDREYKKTGSAPYLKKKRERSTENKKVRTKMTREEVVEKRAAYYLKNRERLTIAAREYTKNISEEGKLKRRVRSENRRRADGGFDVSDVTEILIMQEFLCGNPYCKCDLNETKYHVDHIEPVINGGSHWPDNLQVLCAKCNLGKGRKCMNEWIEYERYKFSKK